MPGLRIGVRLAGFGHRARAYEAATAGVRMS